MSAHVTNTASRHDIDAALLRGAVLLTPHLRIARAESAAFDAARHSAGARLWQPATILPWRAWTTSLWRDAMVAGVDERVLLNDLQERALWEQVIRSGATETLRSVASLARLCASATGLLGAYDLRNDFARTSMSSASDNTDTDTFARWWIHFEARCSKIGFLPASHAETALAEHIRESRIAPAAEYLLHGFDALTPAQQHLLDTLVGAGANVIRTHSSPAAGVPVMLATCASSDDEVARCAAWARSILEKAGRAAIVVPDLPACRPVLERALRAAVAPELADVTAIVSDAPYEFSTGRPLSTLPLIEDALQLLRWCAGELPVDAAGAILRSRLFTIASTPERGAEIDAFILHDKPSLRAVVSMSHVAAWIAQSDPMTATALRTLVAATRNMDGRSNTHAIFADAARSLLRQAGWSGAAGVQSTALNSEEHQAVDRWNEVLDRVASLDALGLRVTFLEFLDRLSVAAQDTTFAPENTGAPLQITTVAEAIGRDDHALWFMHADERTWPPRQRIHPLLPTALQRALRMPGADPREDERTAHLQLDHLVGSTSTAIFSYARSSGDTTQRPSPLVLALDGITPMPLAELTHTSTEAQTLESVDDVAPLPPLPDGVIPGGVGVLSAQALCGFRAFAEKRLFVRDMETSIAGLDAGERGEQVHRVLQAFWTETKNQETLKVMNATHDSEGVSQRDRLLRTCIDAEIASATTKPGSEPWEASYLDVQRERLFHLVKAWLNFEAKRMPFTVEALEKIVPGATVGPLRLDLRLDRIDRVSNGEEEVALLIDYKTGSVVPRKAEWLNERTTEPQLPVYAIAGGIENVGAIAFGSVKVGKCGNRFEGMAEDPKVISAGRNTTTVIFSNDLERWQRDLTQLATAFAEGNADVAPKEYPKTCDLCRQRMLCRLDTARLLDIEDMDEDEDDEAQAW